MIDLKTVKVGDKVRVVSRAKLLSTKSCAAWKGIGFMREMLNSSGLIVTVSYTDGDKRVKFMEDPTQLTWIPDCFISLKRKSKAFSLGDRVIVTGGCSKLTMVNKVGTIKHIDGTGKSAYYGVEFDVNIFGHSCAGKVKVGHGWNLTEDQIKLFKDTEVTEFRNGKYGTLSKLEAFADIKGRKFLDSEGEEIMVYAFIPGNKPQFLTNRSAYMSFTLYDQVSVKVKSMTKGEIEAKLGHKIKIVE